MKVAIESNDGKTVKFPFEQTTGYLFFDLDEKNISDSKYMKIPDITSSTGANYLDECATVITRGMDRDERERLKNQGVEIFVTFKRSAESALSSYIREQLINRHEINQGQV